MGRTETLATYLKSMDERVDPQEHQRELYAVKRFAVCRTEKMGGWVSECPACGTRVVGYNGCHQRGCPTCRQQVQRAWRRRMAARMLRVGHLHVVLSGPEMVTRVWRYRPKAVIESLFAAAARSVKLEAQRQRIKIGMVAVFHSHGAGMMYKAHVHLMVTAGGVDEGGVWRKRRSLNEGRLRDDFRRVMCDELGRRVPTEARNVSTTPSREWQVYVRHHEGNADAMVGYFARTHHGVVVDTEEGLEVGEQTVRFTGTHHGETRRTELTHEVFLDRYVAHIPPKGVVTVRHYGLYATRNKQTLERLREQVEVVETPTESEYEVEERCPMCGAVMRVAIRFDRGMMPPPRLQWEKRRRGMPIAHGAILSDQEWSA